jgi:tetratricopeptide (TPR) repeat protein
MKKPVMAVTLFMLLFTACTTPMNIETNKVNETATSFVESGKTYFRMGEYDKAIADFTQAISINPNTTDVYILRGFAYDEKQDYDKAIADYTQAIRLDPKYATAYGNRGNVYSNKGDYDKAIADLPRQSASIQIVPMSIFFVVLRIMPRVILTRR